MTTKSPVKAAIAIGAGVFLALAMPLAASAHVTVSPYAAKPGSYTMITFKVPNESATATTDSVEIDIPAATPFASISYVPVAGWDVSLVTETLPAPVKLDGGELKRAVTKVIWTAQPGRGLTNGQLQLLGVGVGLVPPGDGAVAVGQLQLLSLEVGPVPDTGKIVMPVIQTYSDGTISRWDKPDPNSEEPAPVLYVTEKPVASPDADAEVTAQSLAESAPAASSDTVARALGIGGLVFGTVGIVLAVVILRRTNAS
jgi:uncharacterized protein YcnI